MLGRNQPDGLAVGGRFDQFHLRQRSQRGRDQHLLRDERSVTVAATQVIGNDIGTNGYWGHGYVWTMVPSTNSPPHFGVPQQLDALVPGYGTANAPWSQITAAGINDPGAIVGTATYSGSNTNIASGSHGVLLAPAYEIQVDAYIPQEWVSNPANSAIQTMLGAFWSLIGNPELVYYGGDQRKVPLDKSFNTGTATFQKNLGYRVRQKVMATVYQELDPSGSQEQEESGEAQNSITGTSTLYLGYQLSGGHIAAGQSL